MEKPMQLLGDQANPHPLHAAEERLSCQAPLQNVADEYGRLTRETLYRGGTSTGDSTTPEEGFSNSLGYNEIESSFIVDIPENSNTSEIKKGDDCLACPIEIDDHTKENFKKDSMLFEVSLQELCEIVNSYTNGLNYEEVAILEKLGGKTGLLEKLKTSSETGLTIGTMFEAQRLHNFGKNKLPKRKLSSFIHLCLEAFKDLILRILVVCGGLSLVIGFIFGNDPAIDWVEGTAIWMAVVVVILVTAGNDWVKERQFDKLSAVSDAKTCSVLRNGEQLEISVFSVMVGDILLVEAGDDIAADCLAISTNNLKMDESALTGESKKIEKVPIDDSIKFSGGINNYDANSKGVTFIDKWRSSVLLSGSAVSEGAGSLVVVAVGVDSTSGNLFGKLVFEAEPTPLQNKLNALAHDIGKAGLISAVLCFFLLVLQFWIIWIFTSHSSIPIPEIIQQHVEAVIISITIVVVAVPEGLPLAVTLSLAYSIGRMLKDQNFVRRLAACEIMGGATEICSDKTGTLTENKMNVFSFWNGHRLEEINTRNQPLQLHNPPYLEPFLEGLALNSTSYLQTDERVVTGKKRKAAVAVGVGSSSECALLFLLQHLGYDYKQMRNEKLQLIHRECFSSERKMMSTVVKLTGKNEGKYRVYVKGAAEKILRSCSHRVDSKGNLKSLDNEEIRRIDKHVIHQMASQALRPLCLAYKDFRPVVGDDWKEYDESCNLFQFEQNLICLGIAGIRDPVRFGVPSAIRQCQNAGITVRMITGDNIETAKQIAIQCNIYHPEAGGVAMLGTDFYKLVGGVVCRLCLTENCECQWDSSTGSTGKSRRVDILGDQEAFRNLAPRLEVLARARPKDKYAMVTGLRAEGAVVAVTGDGTNDAPALKKADVGFAMGIAGKEVAKLAADIVMLDDNFESLVKAVKWGRNIYENIRRFLIFQLTVNVVAVAFTVLTALVLRQATLTAVQLLWVNMIMDSFGSLALATEPPSDDLLKRQPYSRTEYLISRNMFKSILSQAVYQLAVLLFLTFYADQFVPEVKWGYVTDNEREELGFCEFSDCQNFNGTLLRSGRRFFPFRDSGDYLISWETSIGPSRHMTIIFNTFVWMQILNLLNARNMERKWNMFSGLWKNKLWISIFAFIIVGQALFVEFGGLAVSCHLEGLTMMQWGICVLFSLGGIVVHYIMKLFPEQILPEAGQKEMNPLHEPKSIALASRGRISRERISHRLTAGLGQASEAHKNLVRRSRTQHLSSRDTVLRSSTLKM